MALPSPRSVASAFDVLLPVVVSGGMTFLFYVEPILFAYCKNVDKSRTSIPQLYTCALHAQKYASVLNDIKHVNYMLYWVVSIFYIY